MNDRNSNPDQVIATLVVDALRRGHSLSSAETSVLDRLPHIDRLRHAIEAQDLSWLLPLVRSSSDEIAALACSLLHGYVRDPQVADLMLKRWPQASPFLKNRILWRLVTLTSLSDERRETFLDFVLENWETFEQFNRSFYGEQIEARARIQARLNDETIPAHKKWIYWLCLPSFCSDGQERAHILAKGLQSGDDFTHAAIQAYCRKFDLVIA